MRLTDRYPGALDPFEGDRTLTLRSLPAGARVTKATLTLTPAASPDGAGAGATILFDATTGAGSLGATRAPAVLDNATAAATAFLNGRRGVSGVIAAFQTSSSGSTTPSASTGGQVSVQMDIGGMWMGVADDGTLEAPNKRRLLLSLPVKPTTGRPPSTALPLLTTEKIKLTAVTTEDGSPTGNVFLYGVDVRVAASNISVRLGQLPPFWTRPGELGGPATSPDFAAVLNAFLADAQPQNGFYSVPFTLHSDSLARLDVEVSIDFVVEQPVLPPHLPQATATFGASTRPSLADSLTTVSLPRQAIPVTGRSSAQIQGQFGSTRVAAGPIGDTPAVLPVEVGPERSLAQAVVLDQEVHVLAVDVPLGATQAVLSGLHIAFQTDDDGKPSGDILPGGDGQPASAVVRVDRPLPNQSTWGTATFTTPVRLQAAQRYWLVLQSTEGAAFWDATPGSAQAPAVLAPPLLDTDDGGLSWHVATAPRSAQPLAALLRLRHQVDHFTIPIQLQIGTGPQAVRRTLHEFDPLGRVEFTFDFAEALGAHLAAGATTDPCAAGELLVNGGFDDPPVDDAARRLFGFDAAVGPFISGNIDLSQGANLSAQRFITLAIDGDRPRRIDCAGANPARTTLKEIETAINGVLGSKRAFSNLERFLAVNAPDACIGQVALLPWRPPGPPQGWTEVDRPGRDSDRAPRLSRLRWPIRAPQSTTSSLLSTQASVRERIVAALAAEGADPTILAQQVAVSAGCVYVLRAQFDSHRLSDIPFSAASDQHSPATASWEAHWRAGARELRVDRGTLDVEDTGMGFLPLEVYLTAPEGATQVEIRFIQPPPGLLLLDDVSFAATFDRLANSTFAFWRAADEEGPRRPQGWTLVDGSVEQQADGVRLTSDAHDDAILLQTINVTGGRGHSLTVQAHAEQPLADPDAVASTARARLELRWLGDGPLGAAVIIPLDGRDFPTRAWTGAAPAGAKQAEARLVQPAGGGTLLASQVALTEADSVSVPLIFLSETPGELTLSNLRVAYDLPATPPAAPPRPANGRGGLRAAPGAGIRGLALASSGAPPAPAVAPPLEPTVVEPLAPAAPPEPRGAHEPAPAQPPPAPVPAPPAVPLEGEAPPPAGPPGLTDIQGIDATRAHSLVESGVASLADLAAAAPQDIVARLPGVTEAEAEDFIRQARQLVEPEPAPAEPSAPAASDLPLTLVSGLGPARLARLSEAGVDTLQKLAEAAPEDVARVLRGVTVETAARFIEAAREILAARAGGAP